MSSSLLIREQFLFLWISKESIFKDSCFIFNFIKRQNINQLYNSRLLFFIYVYTYICWGMPKYILIIASFCENRANVKLSTIYLSSRLCGNLLTERTCLRIRFRFSDAVVAQRAYCSRGKMHWIIHSPEKWQTRDIFQDTFFLSPKARAQGARSSSRGRLWNRFSKKKRKKINK